MPEQLSHQDDQHFAVPPREHPEGSESLGRRFESTPAMLHLIDMQGRLLVVSDLWLRQLGYTREEVLGRTISSLLTPEAFRYSEYEVLPCFLKTGRVDDVEYQMLAKNGDVLDVLISAVLEHDGMGTPFRILGSVKDITKQRNAERALVAERQRLSNIIEGTHAATWEWNVRTGAMSFNERWAQIIGWRMEEYIAQASSPLPGDIHRDDLVRYDAAITSHFRGKVDRCECEFRVRHRDGSWTWVLDCGTVRSWAKDGRPEWMFGTRLDISERKAQEEALRKSKDFLDRTGELAGIGGWQVDLLTGNVEWSTETYRIHGVDTNHKPTLEGGLAFYAPEAKPVITAAVERGISEGSGWDLELPVIRRDGKRILVRVVGVVTMHDGRPIRLSGAFQDITEARRMTAELAEQHELLRVTLESIGDAVMTADALGCVTWLNPVAERITGWSNADALGHASTEVFRIVHAVTRETCISPIARCLTEGRIVGLESNAVLISRDGSEYGIEDSASPIRNEKGELLGAVLVFHDVTEQRRLAGEISHRASHDVLTGLPNRAEFENRLYDVLQRSEQGSTSALLFIDLDQFKIVNDTCGHAVGDLLLEKVSKLLADCVRANDTLARLGGDEFAIILAGCPMAQATALAETICERMNDFRFTHGGHRFRIGASVGLVPVDDQWTNAAALLQAADSACYAAKEAGRNRVHTWVHTDAGMAARRGEMQWVTRLEHALDEGAFKLFAQRFVSLEADEPKVHAEVLLRMVDKDGSLIPPNAFLPAAERFHLISRIDRWVLGEVIRWMEAAPSLDFLTCLNVNFSGQSVSDRAFHEWVINRLLKCSPEICEKLCIEITETAAVTNLADAGAFIRQLHALKVRVALDDFGSGASWFGYLSKMPVDFLKIDGQFIRDLMNNRLNEATVRCFTEIAKTLNVKTIAEWVEEPAILDRLQEMGISFAQGFLVHRPAPIGELWAVA